MAGAEIPEGKLYFKIGEVAKIVGVKPYVLRYWETEFSVIKPSKSTSKHRLYRRKDVETLLRVRELLHEQRFTIEGARQQLKKEATPASKRSPDSALSPQQLKELAAIKKGLIAVRDSLA